MASSADIPELDPSKIESTSTSSVPAAKAAVSHNDLDDDDDYFETMADPKKDSRPKTIKQIFEALAAKVKADYGVSEDDNDDDDFETVWNPEEDSRLTTATPVQTPLLATAISNDLDDDDNNDTIEVSLPKTTKQKAPSTSTPRQEKRARRAVVILVQQIPSPEPQTAPTNLPSQDRTPRLCEQCAEDEDTMTWTERCRLERHNYEDFICSICEMECRNRTDLFRHGVVHHPWVERECEVCEEIFDTQKTL